MIVVKCNKRNASTLSIETLTVGSAGIEVKFEFSPDWNGMNKSPCFCAGDIASPTEVRRAELTADNTCVIPSEVLRKAGQTVWAGVYGFASDGEIITPTIWASLGTVKHGATADADPSADPTLPIWAQIEAKIGDLADLDTVAKDTLVNAINEAAQGGGGGGTGNHTQLTNRDAADQHPMSAITGLTGALDGKADAEDIPSLDGYATEAWVEGKGYLTQHQSLAAYRTAAAQDAIDAGKQPVGDYATSGELDALADIVDGKQDTISDLSTIRSGAALGATALQSVPSGYATETYVDSAIAAAIGNAIGGAY